MSLLRAAVVLSALVAWSAPVFAEEPGKAPAGEPVKAPVEGSAEEPGKAPVGEPVKAPVEGSAEEPVKAPGGEPAKEVVGEPAEAPGPIASGTAAAASGSVVAGGAAAASGAAAVLPKAPLAPETMNFNAPMSVGLTMFVLSYLPCLLVGPLTEDTRALPLMLPIAGPLILASGATADRVLGWAVFGSFAAAQTIGAGLFAFGALLPREPTRPARSTKKTSLPFRAAPFATPTAWGLSAQGSF